MLLLCSAKDGFPRAEGVTTLYESLEATISKYGDQPALGCRPIVDGTAQDYEWITYNEVQGDALSIFPCTHTEQIVDADRSTCIELTQLYAHCQLNLGSFGCRKGQGFGFWHLGFWSETQRCCFYCDLTRSRHCTQGFPSHSPL